MLRSSPYLRVHLNTRENVVVPSISTTVKLLLYILYDGFLLDAVVGSQRDDGFFFLPFFPDIDAIDGHLFLFVRKKESMVLGPCGPLAQLFLIGLESTVHCVILSVLFFRISTAGNCTRFCCNASSVFVVVWYILIRIANVSPVVILTPTLYCTS